MKRIFVLACFCLLLISEGFSQSIDKILKQPEAEEELKYLSSDKMNGRDTGSPEIDSAAQYIADKLEEYGVKKVEGQNSYFQDVPLVQTSVPSHGELQFMDSTLVHGENVLILRGKDTTAQLPAVYAGYALEADLADMNVKGKMVVAKFGFPGMTNVRDGFPKSKEKRKLLAEKGALGIIELYKSNQINWPLLTLYLNRSSMIVDEHSGSKSPVPYHIFVNDAKGKYADALEERNIKQIGLEVEGLTPVSVKAKNIVGYIEGSDPKLKDEYVILSAHYDHVGHGKATFKHGVAQDSIFNGARDNALGVTGILMAAKYFGKEKPKRSILFIGFTAEEKGLLGSEYYADHPWVPLDQCVFNLNIDCAGYNDTGKATIFGLGRNSAKNHLVEACEKFGLEAIDDPIPDQNIFERSDHYNFAKKGVPSVLYGPGVTAFDEEIQKYYHKVTDEASSLDFPYLMKVYKAFVKGAESIANDENPPVWTAGDKYEPASKELYGQK